MRILVRHGHFAFYPSRVSEVADFCKAFNVALVSEQDYYTFPRLKGLDDYSLPVKIYGNLPAISLWEGKPWEIMEKNKFVYSLSLGLLVPLVTIVGLIDIPNNGPYFSVRMPIIQPGLLTSTGQRVLGYDAEYVSGYQKLNIREVTLG